MFQVIDVFIFLYIYGLYVYPAAFAAVMLYMVRLWACPLITRGPCELVVMVGPDRARIYRVTNRYLPFFTTKKGAYWFSKGKYMTVALPPPKPIKQPRPKKPGLFARKGKAATAEDIVGGSSSGMESRAEDAAVQEQRKAQGLSKNKLHVYFEAVNQPVDNLGEGNRIDSKVTDVMTHYMAMKQVRRHAVQFPPGALAFRRNWALIIKEDGYELQPTRQKQPYKISFFMRIGVYIATKGEREAESANASGDELQSVTVQTIIQKVGDIEEHANYSASFALYLVKKIRFLERRFVPLLLGSLDMRLVIVLMMAVMAIIAIFLFYKPPSIEDLGPMPVH